MDGKKKPQSFTLQRSAVDKMAGPTRLELATSGVTGRRSNQLNYDPALSRMGSGGFLNLFRSGQPDTECGKWWAEQGSNL